MTDNLRDRIIAAIAQADQDWCSDTPLHEDMADAVIAELALEPQSVEAAVVPQRVNLDAAQDPAVVLRDDFAWVVARLGEISTVCVRAAFVRHTNNE